MGAAVTIATKQPSETKPIAVDFSDGLDIAGGDGFDTVTVTVYRWDDQDQVSAEFNIDTNYQADEVEIILRADGELLHQTSLSLADALTVLLVQADNENAWVEVEGILVEGSIGWDDPTGRAWCKVTGGAAGYRYKIVFFAVSDFGMELEQDVIMPVAEY